MLELSSEVLRAISSLLGGDPDRAHSFYTDALAPALRTLERVIADEMAT